MVFWRRGNGQSASSTTGPQRTRASRPPDPEPTIQRLGYDLLQAARSHRTGSLARQFWSDQLMQWAMSNPAFKVQLFRFVDVFPMLRTPQQIHEHLLDHLAQPGVTMPMGLSLGLRAGSLFKQALAGMVTSRILAMARTFILAADPQAALPQLRNLWSQRVGFSTDLLGEACVSDAEAAEYQRRYLELIDTLSREVRDWPANPVLDTDHTGPIPRANVSIKRSPSTLTRVRARLQ